MNRESVWLDIKNTKIVLNLANLKILEVNISYVVQYIN